MTVRIAELAMAILMGVFSLYLMYKSAELPIGWIDPTASNPTAWSVSSRFASHACSRTTRGGSGTRNVHSTSWE